MTEKPSAARLALKWGGITALVEILITTIRFALGYYSGYSGLVFGLLNFAVITTGLVMALREFRRLNGDRFTLGEGVSLGALMFVIIGLLDTFYTQFYQSVIDPNLISKTLEQTRDFMEAQGIPDEQLEKFDDQMSELEAAQRKKGASGSTFLLGVLWWGLGGVILSFITSLFMRREKANPFD
jgi:hypothetical protein